MATFDRLTNSPNDKAYQYVGGSSSVSSFYSGNLSGSGVNGAFRFDDITIPKNTMIGEAKIFIYPNQQGYNWFRTTIYGIDAGDITGFNNINPFTQPKTSTGTFNQKQMQNKNYQDGGIMEFSVTGQVQAIVNRSDWVSGHAMGFILENDNSDNGCCVWREPFRYTVDGIEYSIDFYIQLSVSYFDLTTTSTSSSTSTTNTSTSTTTLLDDWGIKMSAQGVDVKTAGTNDLVYSSKYNTFKVFSQGTTSGTDITIPHNLGYAPTFEVFMESGSNRYRLPRLQNPTVSGYVQAYAYSDATNLRIISNLSTNFYYYIFYEAIPT